MPKQRLPDIPEDINLFEIPRKKPPAEVPPPPPPSSPPPAPQVRGPGRGGPPAHNSESAAPGPHTNQQAKYWEQKVREHAAENLKLHQKLQAVTKHRDELLTVLSTQQQGGAALEEARAALEAESVNVRQLEQQLTHLQARLHDLTGKTAEKDQQLAHSAAELGRVRAELETQAADRAAALAELREQLATARETAERAEVSLRAEAAKARESAADLANLRLTHLELQRQWEESRKTAAELGKRNDELEQRLADRVGEVQHLRSELDRRGTSYADEFALRARLKEELRIEYNARLANEQEVTERLRRQNDELAARLRDLETANRNLDRRASEREEAESVLTRQLHATQAAAEKAQTNYGKEAARANKLEKTLEGLKLSREELSEKLAAERKEAAKFKRKAEQLEERVARTEETLKRTKADLERQISARKRLADGGAPAGELADMDQRVRETVGAIARATADLEAERRRLESAAFQSRVPSLDATRIGQAFANSLRSQLRPSAENLMQSIRELLGYALENDQKRLAETALENALVIQAGLQEANTPPE